MSLSTPSLNRRVLVGLFAFSICLLSAITVPSPAIAQDRIWHGYVDGVFRGGSNREVGTLDLFAPLMQSENELLFADMRGGLGDDGSAEGNWGLGYRRMLPSGWIAGMYGFYDLRESAFGNTFHQAMFGAELMDVNWDFRINGYVPDGSPKFAAGGGGPSGILFSGNNIFLATPAGGEERAYYGMDAEIGRLLYLFGGPLDAEVRGYVGGYYFDNDAAGFPEVAGPRARVELRMFDLPWLGPESRVVFGGEIQYDNVRDTHAVGLVQVRIPLGRLFSRGSSLTPLQRRMVEPIVRDIDVVTNSTPSKAQTQTLLTVGGNPIALAHVNDSGAIGDGSFENPHGSLTSANTDPQKANRDIVYVHSGTTFNGQNYQLAPNQRFLGEGDNNQHYVQTDQLGRINLPAVNGIANARPILSYLPNSIGGAINVANDTEVSNFAIQDSGAGIFAIDVTGDVNVNRTLITGGAIGIDILSSSGTFTFTDVTVANSSTAGINVNGGSSTVDFGGPVDPLAGFYGPSMIDQNANGSAVAITGGHSGSFTQGTGSEIIATNGDGLQLDNANGNYNFNGPVTLAGGNAGIDILGDSNGTFTFANTDITSPTGTGINVDGGTANVTFGPDSSVTQATGATAINVQGGHNGVLRFGGSVDATNGDGLQFSNARGLYEFTGQVTLAGGDAGIDILGNSAGTFTFTNADITNPTGAGINVDGGTADVAFGSGSSVTQATGATAINIQGGHNTGTFGFGGSINATNGDGLQFDNAHGHYEFFGPVTLNGGNAGIDILGNSAGTFTFSNTDITNPTGEGINIDGGTAAVAFGPGSSVAQATGATAINVQGGHFGQLILDGTVDATNGDGLQFDNANGIYEFNGPVTLAGGDAGIDILGGSAGTFTFSNTTITDPTGIGLNVDGGSADVTFESGSSITQNTFNQPLIDMMGGHTGTVTFDLGTNLNAQAGTGLQFMDADGTYNFNGNITLNGGDAGIDIISDSAGTFTFAGTTSITNSTGLAVNIDGGVAGQDAQVTFNELDIDQSVGAGVLANNSGTLTIVNGFIDNTSADGINVTNTNLNVGSIAPSFVVIGSTGSIGGDGIEVVNNDATDRTVTIINNDIGSFGNQVGNRGICINSTGTGTLNAIIRGNQINATNQAILTNSGFTAGSLVLDLQNSTITTTAPNTLTEEHVGSALHSTIVRRWTAPNQVVGSPPGSGGIRFNLVTFDADADPSNGFQQVTVDGSGTIEIGQNAGRVQGDGLSFINPWGDLNIPTLNVWNENGTGLEVDTKALGTTFNLVVGGGTIDTVGGPALYLDPLTANMTFDSVSSTDSAIVGLPSAQASGNGTGITLLQVDGTVSINSFSIDNPAIGAIVGVDNTGTFNFTNGTITGAPAGSILFVGGADVEIHDPPIAGPLPITLPDPAPGATYTLENISN